MKKIFAILMAMCMLFACVACSNNNSTDPTTPGTTNQPKDIHEYVKTKYGDHLLLREETDTMARYFDDQAKVTVVAYTVDYLTTQMGMDASQFTGKWADNGYFRYARSDFDEYYKQFFAGDYGTSKVILVCDATAFPSAMTTDRTVAENMADYKSQIGVTAYLLTDKELDSAALNDIIDAVTAADHMMILRVAIVPAADQANYDYTNIVSSWATMNQYVNEMINMN